MDKAEQTISKQLDIVSFLRQQILLQDMLKIQYSSLERCVMRKSKKFLIYESDNGNECQNSFSDDECLERRLECESVDKWDQGRDHPHLDKIIERVFLQRK